MATYNIVDCSKGKPGEGEQTVVEGPDLKFDPIPEPTLAEKLAAAGISLDELKAALK